MAKYLVNFLRYEFPLGAHNLDVNVIVSGVMGLCVSPLVLFVEQITEYEKDEGADEVADTNHDPGNMVSGSSLR